MKKIFFLLGCVLAPFLLKAQEPQPVYGDYVYPGNILFDNGLYIPVRDTAGFAPYRVGALVILPQDTVGHPAAPPVRFWNGNYWGSIAGGAGNIYFGSNGVLLVGNTFKLGGGLNQNTDITTGSFNFSLNGTSKNAPVFRLTGYSQQLGYREIDSTLSGFDFTPGGKNGIFRLYSGGVPIGFFQQGSIQFSDSLLNSFLSAGKDHLTLTGPSGADYAQISPGSTTLSTSSGSPYAVLNNTLVRLPALSNSDTVRYVTTDATGKLILRTPSGIRAIDSVVYDPISATFGYRYIDGTYLPVPTGLVDSLANKLTWDSPLTPLLTQPGIPIQPTTKLINAMGQLQQQINDFSGKYIEVNPTLSQPGVNAKTTGTMNITTTSSNGYGLNIERPNNVSYDAALGYRSGGSVVGWAGLGNRNNNDYSIQFLTARTRLVNADSSGIQFIGVSQYGGLRMFAKFKNEKLLMGDSMQASAEAIAPIHVGNTADTGIYALHKIVTDVNLPATDSSHIVANTKYVKDQIAGYNTKYVQLSPATAQTGAAVNLTGNVTLNRANTSTTAAYSILTGGVQTGYFGAASIGSNSLVVTASNGPLALYAPDSTSLNVTSYGAVTPGNTFIKARSGKTVFGDSLASNVFGRYPIDVISIQDTSLRTVNRIVQDYNLSLSDNSKTVVTSSWIVSQGFQKAANATLQAATTAGNTTGNIIKITGSTGSLAGTNGGLEMFWDGTQCVLQGYDRVAAILKTIKLSASIVNIVAGLQLPIRTVTGTVTANTSDYTILVNNTGAATINLPAVASSSGTVLIIKKLSAASNDVTIDPNASETIDGVSTKVLTLQYSSVTLQCNGTSWFITSSHAAATTL